MHNPHRAKGGSLDSLPLNEEHEDGGLQRSKDTKLRRADGSFRARHARQLWVALGTQEASVSRAMSHAERQ